MDVKMLQLLSSQREEADDPTVHFGYPKNGRGEHGISDPNTDPGFIAGLEPG